MRSLLVLLLSTTFASLVGCTAPSVGGYGDDSDRPLPHRSHDADDDDDDSASASDDTKQPGTGSTSSATTATKQSLTVNSTGDGTGAVTSDPAGVTCSGKTCTGSFAAGTKVTLTAQAQDGSIFTGWTGGGCTGTTTCTTTLAQASTVSASFITLAGTWTGTYSHSEQNGNCTFNNKGNLENTMAGSSGSFTTAAQMNGFEIRNLNDCSLQGALRDGSASASAATVSGNTVTGTWNIQISGISGSLPLPFTATIVGTKMSGKWTCTGCTGTFDISKQ